MIRLIVRAQDAGPAYGGGEVQVEYLTFDVDLPEVERSLRSFTGHAHAQVVGAEILPPKDPSHD